MPRRTSLFVYARLIDSFILLNRKSKRAITIIRFSWEALFSAIASGFLRPAAFQVGLLPISGFQLFEKTFSCEFIQQALIEEPIDFELRLRSPRLPGNNFQNIS